MKGALAWADLGVGGFVYASATCSLGATSSVIPFCTCCNLQKGKTKAINPKNTLARESKLLILEFTKNVHSSPQQERARTLH